MKMLRKIADQRIVEAMERGEFDDLQGAGRPLSLDDDSLVPQEQRLANRVLKNAGYLPEEVRLRSDIAALQRLVLDEGDDELRSSALRRLDLLRLRLESGRRRTASMLLEDSYRDRLIDKLKR